MKFSRRIILAQLLPTDGDTEKITNLFQSFNASSNFTTVQAVDSDKHLLASLSSARGFNVYMKIVDV